MRSLLLCATALLPLLTLARPASPRAESQPAPPLPAEATLLTTSAGCAIGRMPAEADGVEPMVAVCHWSESPEQVWAQVCDLSRHTVLSSTAASTPLGDGRWQQLHVGPGIRDRAATLDVDIRQEGGWRGCLWRLSGTQRPPEAHERPVVRDDGHWWIQPAPEGGTRVRYRLAYDPGADVPMTLIRFFQRRGIAQLVREMRQAIE